MTTTSPGLIVCLLHGVERRFFAVEDARRTAMMRAVSWPATLTTQPSGARLPCRMTRPPVGLSGLLERAHDLLARRFVRRRRFLADACGR